MSILVSSYYACHYISELRYSHSHIDSPTPKYVSRSLTYPKILCDNQIMCYDALLLGGSCICCRPLYFRVAAIHVLRDWRSLHGRRIHVTHLPSPWLLFCVLVVTLIFHVKYTRTWHSDQTWNDFVISFRH